MLSHAIFRKALLLIALHGAATFDAITTEKVLNRRPLVVTPTVTMTYRGGEEITTVGPYLIPQAGHEMNPLLGKHPSAPRAYVQINGDALIADLLLLKHRRGARAVAAGVIAEHVALGIRNLTEGSR